MTSPLANVLTFPATSLAQALTGFSQSIWWTLSTREKERERDGSGTPFLLHSRVRALSQRSIEPRCCAVPSRLWWRSGPIYLYTIRRSIDTHIHATNPPTAIAVRPLSEHVLYRRTYNVLGSRKKHVLCCAREYHLTVSPHVRISVPR